MVAFLRVNQVAINLPCNFRSPELDTIGTLSVCIRLMHIHSQRHMGLASTPPAHQLQAVAIDTLRVRKSKMQSSSSAFLFSMLVVLVLAAFIPSNVEAQEYRPILMNRRDLLPYGDIVSELKGKTLGGRMRFGKRSMNPYQPIPFETLGTYDRQQQV